MTGETVNPGDPIENLAIGRIIEVDGAHIVAELDPQISELARVYAGEVYPIGQFGSIIKVHFGRVIIYGYVGRLRMKAEYEMAKGIPVTLSSEGRVVEADLFGEGEWILSSESKPPTWNLRFERGVSTYPLPQQGVYLTPTQELRFIYGHGKGATIRLGEHVGSGGTPCYADINELLGKHTAILGSTGAGKSGATAAILHSILEHGTMEGYGRWEPRIVILDPHNEYHAAFPTHSRLSTDEGTLTLPYWLLSFQETISLLIGKTEFVATSQANIVKTALLRARMAAALAIKLDPQKLTVDSPTPYMLDVFIAEVESQRPPGKNKQEQEPYNSVLHKLEVLRSDTRLNFIMEPWNGTDDLIVDVIAQFVGIGGLLRIVDLSGVPNEVAGLASAAIARTLFNFKVWQTSAERELSPILLVCEEAHRYVPNRGEAQYEGAQEAVRRIAKEGRKYGIGLILVSQRPSEVEETVLSQCNSWIVLRLTNDTDREHVRSILPDSLAGLTKVLSGLRRREAIFVGQAAMLPSRILIRLLERAQLPRSHDIDFDAGWQSAPLECQALQDISNRWRLQQRKA
jgi:hypothetical protein